MKRFTIIFSILLVLGFAGTLGYVAMSENFQEPTALVGEGEDPDAPVWGMTTDDMLDYLEAKGFLDRKDVGLLSGGIGTEAYKFNGAELYWWDLENLPEGSDEAAAYQNLLDGEPIDLWQMGQYFLTVTKNGPFAISIANYTGDPKALQAAFEAFGQNGSGNNADAPVWGMSMEDLTNYFIEQGFLESADDLGLLAGGIATEAYDMDGAEFYWWDVENLLEGSAEEIAYQSMQAEGMIDVYSSGNMMAITPNGPFGLSVTYYNGDAKALMAAFEAFGRE